MPEQQQQRDSFDNNLKKINQNHNDKFQRYHLMTMTSAFIGVALVIVLFNYNTRHDDKVYHGNFNHRELDIATPEEQELSLFPLRVWDYVGLSCAMVGLILAAGGGIGGGGILVPVYILLLRFPVKHAVSLSNVTVFGGGLANNLLNCYKRHPYANRPLIDWNVMIVMEPPTMAGALIGAHLNELLPDIVIVILLVLLLSFTAYKTLKKATDMHQKETHEFNEDVNHDPDEEIPLTPTMVIDPKHRPHHIKTRLFFEREEEDKSAVVGYPKHASLQQEVSLTPLLTGGGEKVERTDEMSNSPSSSTKTSSSTSKQYGSIISVNSENDNDSYPSLDEILEKEKHTNMHNLGVIVLLFVTVILINVLKGGGAFESPLGIECGSWGYYVAELIMLSCVVGAVCYARSYLVHQTNIKEQVNYEYVEGDIIWNTHSTIIYPALCTIAGLAAGMFGIGGGIIKGPLMLAMGLHPAVVSATSACMILFTSFTATSSYMLFGELNYQYAGVCLVLGFVATLFGQTVMSILVAKYKRNSLIAYAIGLVVAISAMAMTVESILALLVVQDEATKGSGLCSVTA